MLGITMRLLVGVFLLGFASCSNKCPDGNVCPDSATCCLTAHGYSCCPYPKAICCLDYSHCCPWGFRCNLVTQMCEKNNQPWASIPMERKEDAEEPSASVLSTSPLQRLEDNAVSVQQKSSVVHCDNQYYCPDGTTCCRHPKGAWFCCPYSSGRCCLDGYHCCPYGYDCDLTYTHCVRQSLKYPFTLKQALSSVPATRISTPEEQSSKEEMPMTTLSEARDGITEDGVIRCDSTSYCPQRTTCCKGRAGRWSCCPYPLGQCCADGKHCCQYGYKCDPTSLTCRRWFSQIPSGAQEPAETD